MTYIVLALGVVAFVAGLRFTRLVPRVSRVVSDVRSTAAVLRSTTASEAQKEAAARSSAARMSGAFVLIVASLLVALVLPLALLLLASRLGICTVGEALRTGATWQALVGATGLTFVVMKVWR
jgi:hypothetical protein